VLENSRSWDECSLLEIKAFEQRAEEKSGIYSYENRKNQLGWMQPSRSNFDRAERLGNFS
jgi:hypothetical protein